MRAVVARWAAYDGIVERLAGMGYETNRLVKTVH